MSRSNHPDAAKIKKLLDQYGIDRLFHFTCVDNLSTISKSQAIWSKEKLEDKDLLEAVFCGGTTGSVIADRQHGNWNRIHVYFCPKTPMAYKVQENADRSHKQSGHICYFIIDPVVALWEGVHFSDTNAARKDNGHKQEEGINGVSLVDWKTIRSHLNGIFVDTKIWLRNVQAECLIPESIPLSNIHEVCFMSQASLKEGERLWGNMSRPQFRVDESLFHRGFPLVKDFILTENSIDKNNCSSSHQDTRVVTSERVTLLVSLHGTAGVKSRTVWHDSSSTVIRDSSTEFERSGEFWNWSNLSVEHIPNGQYYVEYYLGEIRWFHADFEIRRYP